MNIRRRPTTFRVRFVASSPAAPHLAFSKQSFFLPQMRSTARVRFRRLERKPATRGPSQPILTTLFSADNRIRDTLNNLILRSPSDWQTTAALPFTKIDGVVRCRAAHTPPRPRAPRHETDAHLPSLSDRRVG